MGQVFGPRLSSGEAPEVFFQPGNLIVRSYLSSRFQWVGKPQISQCRQQSTIIEPLLYFPIWSPARPAPGR